MDKRYKRKDLFKKILNTIVASTKVSSFMLSKRQLHFKLEALSYGDRNRIGQSLRRLTKNKYIKTKEKGDEVLLEVTPLGFKKKLEYDYDDISIKKPRRWDGKWRIVIFDIPESKKKVRNSINIKLKELGFDALQKSTFIYPYECRREIEFIKNHFFLKNEISYILAEDLDRENDFIKRFSL